MSTASRSWTWISAVLIVIAVGLAVFGLRQNQQTTELSAERFAAARQAMEAAAAATTTVLSYSHQTVDRDVAAAKELTTGEFRDSYAKFTTAVLIPKAREKQVSVRATTVGTGIQTLNDNEATVLVFINQSSTSSASPEPQKSTSSAVVGMSRVGGVWKIATFEKI